MSPKSSRSYAFLFALGLFMGLWLPVKLAQPAVAHLDNADHVGTYTYGDDSQCTEGSEIDPITVVFYGDAYPANVDVHAQEHGSWTETSQGQPQDFYDHGCVNQDGANADGCEACTRHHMRYSQASVDGTFGVFTLASPHHEEITVWPGCGLFGVSHTVDDNELEPPGGFIRGRTEIANLWHWWGAPGAPHGFGGILNWDNDMPMDQCDGTTAWSDGWVHLVELNVGDLFSVTDSTTDHYERIVPESTWQTLAGTPANQGRNLVYFGDGLLFYGVNATGGTFHRSTDTGTSWTALTSPDTNLKPINVSRSTGGRVWSLWEGSSTAKVYYSDDEGDTWVGADSFTISTGIAGSIDAHPTDDDRIAVAWVTGATSLRVRVTTDGGGNWTQYSPGFSGGVLPQVAWSGSSIIIVGDNGSTLRLLHSSDDGQNWTQAATLSTTAISETSLGITRAGTDTAFAFASSSDTTPPHGILRTDNDGEDWQQVGALPSIGLMQSIRAVAYDADADTLYVAWFNSGKLSLIRNATARVWESVTAADWNTVASLPEKAGVRALVVMDDR